MPGGHEPKPFGAAAVRLLGHFEKEPKLFQRRIGLIEFFGEEPCQTFTGIEVVGIACELFDTGLGLLLRLLFFLG